MLKAALIAIGLWVVSLTALVASLALGDFGASLWLIVPLLIWLVSLGAPTTAAVLILVWIWPGGSFLLFLGLASAAALFAQFLAMWTSIKLLQRRRVDRHDELHSA
jgi:hypothetical protein